MLQRLLSTLFALAISFFCVAQQDSLGLILNRLKAEDLILTTDKIGKQQVVSASRSLKTLEDLPLSIYVITQEEIFKNGYTTLVDVLKSLPGIRVSQPGSALDGETFLMRGLYGNSYAKILINDLPIKPSAVGGMPIGAQLPIRQAERIEVIFGPAAAVYGADASSGVINIILKETEKPLFTRADLSVGSNAYNDLNVMFGGRIGKGKRILRFSVYGSNTVFDDRNTKYDSNLYNPRSYSGQDSSYLSNPNYRGTPRKPVLNTLPHLSRMFGIDLRYRALQFSYNQMYRRDHSAIGLNPFSVSYTNPLNYIGETITRFNIGLRKNFKNSGFTANLTLLNYNMDVRSSYTYVNNTLWRFLDLQVDEIANTPMERDSLSSTIFNNVFSGSRFSYAESADAIGEVLLNFRPYSGIEIVAGANIQYSYNQPIINYLKRAPDAGLFFSDIVADSTDFPFLPFEEYFYTFGAFGQAYMTFKGLTLMLGMRFDQTELYGGVFNPRLAIQYRPGKNFSVRANYSTAFRVPTTFYGANTYLVEFGNLNSLRTNGNQQLSAESTSSYELGLQWNNHRNVFADVSFFYSQTENIISYNFDAATPTPNPLTTVTLGYLNDEESAIDIYGLQSRFLIKNIVPSYKLDLEFNFSYTLGKEILPFGKGELDQVRMQPKVLARMNVSLSPGNKFYINLKNGYSTSWINRFVIDEDNTFSTPGYYTLDVLVRYELNRNFQIYTDLNNLFSKQYGGIGATGFADDLFYNPQPQRTLRFGLSYTMN